MEPDPITGLRVLFGSDEHFRMTLTRDEAIKAGRENLKFLEDRQIRFPEIPEEGKVNLRRAIQAWKDRLWYFEQQSEGWVTEFLHLGPEDSPLNVAVREFLRSCGKEHAE